MLNILLSGLLTQYLIEPSKQIRLELEISSLYVLKNSIELVDVDGSNEVNESLDEVGLGGVRGVLESPLRPRQAVLQDKAIVSCSNH